MQVRPRNALLSLLASLAGAADGTAQDTFAAERARMVEDIVAMARSASAETGKAALSPQVLEAIGRVQRHRFVPSDLKAHAYENRPLAIGSGQTISQPYIVAYMTDVLAPQKAHRVLEVGTGSGYQSAVLAELAGMVFSIEIVDALGRQAATALRDGGYQNVRTRIGDGYLGWPEEAPFDGILVTAAAPEVPQPLVDQLKPGGRLVIPVGGRFGTQEIVIVEKLPDGRTTTRRSLPVRFVPLTRGNPR
jgi:protein-L-isoaspartate(D-aspartate) O-methyltransferase